MPATRSTKGGGGMRVRITVEGLDGHWDVEIPDDNVDVIVR